MSESENEEIIPYLQATNPRLATALTMERRLLLRELVDARAARERAEAALLEAVKTIRVWHDIKHGTTKSLCDELWALYQESPEMKRITGPIRAAAASGTGEPGEIDPPVADGSVLLRAGREGTVPPLDEEY